MTGKPYKVTIANHTQYGSKRNLVVVFENGHAAREFTKLSEELIVSRLALRVFGTKHRQIIMPTIENGSDTHSE